MIPFNNNTPTNQLSYFFKKKWSSRGLIRNDGEPKRFINTIFKFPNSNHYNIQLNMPTTNMTNLTKMGSPKCIVRVRLTGIKKVTMKSGLDLKTKKDLY